MILAGHVDALLSGYRSNLDLWCDTLAADLSGTHQSFEIPLFHHQAALLALWPPTKTQRNHPTSNEKRHNSQKAQQRWY